MSVGPRSASVDRSSTGNDRQMLPTSGRLISGKPDVDSFMANPGQNIIGNQHHVSSKQSKMVQRIQSGVTRSHAAPVHPAMATRSASRDEEDTMKNLRKTFAGIFGDM